MHGMSPNSVSADIHFNSFLSCRCDSQRCLMRSVQFTLYPASNPSGLPAGGRHSCVLPSYPLQTTVLHAAVWIHNMALNPTVYKAHCLASPTLHICQPSQGHLCIVGHDFIVQTSMSGLYSSVMSSCRVTSCNTTWQTCCCMLMTRSAARYAVLLQRHVGDFLHNLQHGSAACQSYLSIYQHKAGWVKMHASILHAWQLLDVQHTPSWANHAFLSTC